MFSDGYCTVDQAERAGDAPCHMIEREAFQVSAHVVSCSNMLKYIHNTLILIL